MKGKPWTAREDDLLLKAVQKHQPNGFIWEYVQDEAWPKIRAEVVKITGIVRPPLSFRVRFYLLRTLPPRSVTRRRNQRTMKQYWAFPAQILRYPGIPPILQDFILDAALAAGRSRLMEELRKHAPDQMPRGLAFYLTQQGRLDFE